ncbi:hypothetical protein ARMGADRAFT_288173 [Armillaria gallica]|uniref:Uncharacterized protein n=1 Tax=Armillaria gallica TaxID=47427 RepID=A0A2H3C7K8_ARMGA|nr:hypothetical protein ARMGADRAFT_288173 [Armillaria gallica]
MIKVVKLQTSPRENLPCFGMHGLPFHADRSYIRLGDSFGAKRKPEGYKRRCASSKNASSYPILPISSISPPFLSPSPPFLISFFRHTSSMCTTSGSLCSTLCTMSICVPSLTRRDLVTGNVLIWAGFDDRRLLL